LEYYHSDHFQARRDIPTCQGHRFLVVYSPSSRLMKNRSIGGVYNYTMISEQDPPADSVGILPVKKLRETLNVRNKERLPTDGEIVPSNDELKSVMAITLLV